MKKKICSHFFFSFTISRIYYQFGIKRRLKTRTEIQLKLGYQTVLTKFLPHADSFIFLAVSSLSTLTPAKFCWYSGITLLPYTLFQNHPCSSPGNYVPIYSYILLCTSIFAAHLFVIPLIPSNPGLNIYIKQKDHFFLSIFL